jgi:hypothetical protein
MLSAKEGGPQRRYGCSASEKEFLTLLGIEPFTHPLARHISYQGTMSPSLGFSVQVTMSMDSYCFIEK